MRTTIRQQLIEALSDAEGEFLSGQALAEIIGCSRTAIWKHIEELRKDGFVLEAVRNKGYRIVSTPEEMTENDILYGLETERFGRNIHYYESLGSTQKAAHQLAHDGAPEGTLVIAEEQTSGRGRLGREWHSLSGKGIWMSLIVKPDLPPQKAPQFTLISAVAVARAVEEITGITPEIKWPNDVLIRGKKVVGILTELQAESDKISSLIIGIGMNANHGQEDFPEHVAHTATSLFIEKGEKISRAALIQCFLKYFERYYSIYISDGFKPIRLLWESYAISIGKRIRATTVSGVITGRAIGITDEGVLKIEDDEGIIHHIYSADIQQT
ncbi:MAG TPA: biotin--[acetyl-CoA-carboxylase] ligase [Bacillus bacterium]|uniref:Bifunctional ligase/repressor BirA n=1 Tax=Siminovitchia fordii TaxID=254759 RepID=A0ABQ4K8A0_9BACI|nr:biotin--[acetyl-CoA-carboxylase] ligase [Siminovitchia fordii]GIN21073.1 bifunctional ligase/repressor BirA [Siminovitchia fordii]HBZ09452.1 biotin--[acetyl-CoA-carboxylase] ligase [Bacillus sp. (in: firmicutes)]